MKRGWLKSSADARRFWRGKQRLWLAMKFRARLGKSRCQASRDVADYPKHYCGVFGVYGHPNAAELTYYGLYALQHRGQESAGIVTSDGRRFRAHRGMGLVSQVFTGEILHHLVGAIAVGHTRYSTTGSSHIQNAQPLTVDCKRGQIAIAHNGNLTNAVSLREELEAKGSIFTTSVDSEIILHL